MATNKKQLKISTTQKFVTSTTMIKKNQIKRLSQPDIT